MHLQYYTPETVDRAKRVFGPFMDRWGYPSPPEWGDTPASARLQFVLFAGPRYAFWRFVRKNTGLSRWLRRRSG